MSNVVQLTEVREKKMADGFCAVPTEIIDAMASGHLTAREFKILCAVIRKTYGWNKEQDSISGSQLEALTGIRRQEASMVLVGLIEKGVLIRLGGSRSPLKVNLDVDSWNTEKQSKPDNITAAKQAEKDRVTTSSELSSLTTKYSHRVTTKARHTIDNIDTMNTPAEYLSTSDAEDAPKPEKAKRDKFPDCPYQAIVDLYHEILPELREVAVLNETRKRLIRARWRSKAKKTECWNLDFWRRYFEYVRKCDFLMGRKDPSSNRPPFTADLEWLVRPTNFAKVVEGKYDH